MFRVNMSTRECDGFAVVSLQGEPAAVAAPERRIIIGLAGPEFVDSSGLARRLHASPSAGRGISRRWDLKER